MYCPKKMKKKKKIAVLAEGNEASHDWLLGPETPRAEQILQAVGAAYLELDYTARCRYLNQCAQEFWRVTPAEVLGKTIHEAFPAFVDSTEFGFMARALRERVPTQDQYFSPVNHRWMYWSATPQPDSVLFMFHALPAIPDSSEKLKEENRKLKDAQAVGQIGSFERYLPEDRLSWSDEMYRIHGLEPQSEEMTLTRCVALVHPEDQAQLKAAIRLLETQEKPLDLVQRIVRPDGSVRYVHRKAEIIRGEPGRASKVYGTVQDITRQKQAEEELAQSKELFQAVLQTVPLGIMVLQAVRDAQNTIVDFRYTMSNGVAERHLRVDLIGQTVRGVLAGYLNEENFRQMVTTVQTGQPAEYTYLYHRPDGPVWLYTHCYQLNDSLVVSQEDITARKKAEAALQHSRQLVKATLDSSPNMIEALEAVRDARGEIVDFRWLVINHQAAALLGEVIGQSLLQHKPGVVPAGLFQKFVQVVETGKSLRFKTEYRHKPYDGWYDLSVQKMNDGVVITTLDITERKRAADRIKEQAHFIAGIAAATPDVLLVMDLTTQQITYCNRPVATLMGYSKKQIAKMTNPFLDLIYAEDLPLVQQHIQAIKEAPNGEVKEVEYRLQHADGTLRWFLDRSTVFRRNEAGEVTEKICISQDVTARKQQQEEITKNLNILQQSEELAHLGSWEYYLPTGEFSWSEGMYRLFGLPPGTPVTPEIYLNFVVPEDRLLAQKIVASIRQGALPFEETLRLLTDGQIRTLKLKAVVIPNEQGQLVKVLGVDLDVTEVQRLEADYLQLQLHQQKELLLAILDTQEEERRRIAEGLHNGIGQLLYAAKLNLDQIKLKDIAADAGQTHHYKDQADQLLREAIIQTRRVSHELIPTTLEDFGLAIAINDIGTKYSNPSFSLHCRVSNVRSPLEKHLQLAIYRMAQELANNIVKHADATAASIQIAEQADCISIMAEDNGRGFNTRQAKVKGLGLKAIRDRVKLLNGTLEIDSNPHQGTLISIYLPLATS